LASSRWTDAQRQKRDTLDYLHGLDTALWGEIDPEGSGEIECLPFRINQMLLRVYTSLLFGVHYEAGRAIAVYAGIMGAALDFYTAAGAIGGNSPPSDFPKYIAVLKDHRDVAAKIAWTFLCAGKSDEFGDYTKPAKIVYDCLFAVSRERALEFMRGLERP
jgi:hypothetical protein